MRGRVANGEEQKNSEDCVDATKHCLTGQFGTPFQDRISPHQEEETDQGQNHLKNPLAKHEVLLSKISSVRGSA
jgi:hypothetical protein